MKTSFAAATGTVSALTLLSRILGLIRDMVIARFFGAGIAADAFFAALRIPNLLRRSVAEGAVTSAFVPVFALEEREGRGQAALSVATSALFLLSSIVALLGILFSDQIVSILSPGFATGSEKAHLTSHLLAIMFPFVIAISLVAVFTGALNALARFGLSSLPSSILNICIIAALILSPAPKQIEHLAWAVLAGGAIGAVMLFMQLRLIGRAPGLFALRLTPALLQMFRLFVPSAFAASLYQIMVLINTMLASMLPEGSISWLYYADRLFQFPVGIFSTALATVALPLLSSLVVAGRHDLLAAEVERLIGWVSFITLPAMVGLVGLGAPITSLVYEHGTFSPTSTHETTRALIAYALGLWPLSAQMILARVFLARRETRIPAIVSAVTILLNIVIAIALMGRPEQGPKALLGIIGALTLAPLRHVGLALAGSISAFAAAFLYLHLCQKHGVRRVEIGRRALKILLSCIPMLAFLLILRALIVRELVLVLIGVPAGALVYFSVCRALHIPEMTESLKLFTRLRANFRSDRETFSDTGRY